jgi:hypothetical protein
MKRNTFLVVLCMVIGFALTLPAQRYYQGDLTTPPGSLAAFANQGTTVLVLHGNAAGNPSFGPVNLAADVSGALPIGNVGSSGLSGTSPVAISAAGVISCTTCSTTTGTVTSVATSAPLGGGTITASGTLTCTTCTVTIASGTKALATGAISSATCTTVQTATATGTLTTDTVMADFNADPTAVTGYAPVTSGMLTIIKYPTADTVNFKVCNLTSTSITPGAVTLNFRVAR